MNKQPYFSKAAHRQTSDQVSDNISDLAWSHLDVEPAELSEVAENREVFRLPLELLPPRPPKRKSGFEK